MPFPGEYPFRLRRLGLLRSDVVPSLDGEYLLLLNRTSLMPVARKRIEHAQELQRWERHGVPLLILYRVGKPREPGR
jgi:hypothetical protein